MSELWGQNVKSIYGENQFYIEDHRTGSTDMGDLGHIMPVTHPYIFGATGNGHGNDYLMADKEAVYINMAKLLAMTTIDLLCNEGGQAQEILSGQRPKLSKSEYLEFNRNLMKKVCYTPDEVTHE